MGTQGSQVGTIHDDGAGLTQQLTLPGCEHLGEHHRVVSSADAGQINGDATASLCLLCRAGTPVTIHPDIGLHIGHIRIHAQAHFHIAAHIAAEIDTLRAWVAHPEVRRRGGDIYRRRAENSQHQRSLHGQQNARKAHGEHRGHKASPLMNQRFSRQCNHGCTSAGCAATTASTGAAPTALYKAT